MLIVFIESVALPDPRIGVRTTRKVIAMVSLPRPECIRGYQEIDDYTDDLLGILFVTR